LPLQRPNPKDAGTLLCSVSKPCGKSIINRQLGIGLYSLKLDSQGKSMRGILACKELAGHFGLHAFEFTNVGSSFMQ
jgi:hypothetical protein